MNNDSLRDTIEPKSDQLNADDLTAGPITVTVQDVKRGSPDQPVQIAIEGRRPYRPCKSMRRVLIAAWGDKGKEWIGRSMTLFCDPTVKFGGVAMGGIRISHLSHIDKDYSMMLTTTRARRSSYQVHKLEAESLPAYPESDFKANIATWVTAIVAGKSTTKKLADQIAAAKAPLSDAQRSELERLVADAQSQASTDGGAVITADELAERVQKATNEDQLSEIEDLVRSLEDAQEQFAVRAIIGKRREALAG